MAIFKPNFINEAKRSDLPDSSFGIPEDRKYPLDTKEHVKSAIKLFGHAEESKKKSLAKRIQNAAKKYNIDIPENTQCYKYLHESISESTHKNIEYKTISSSNPEFKKYLKKYNIVKDPDSVSKEYNGDILIDVKEDKLIGHVFIGNTKDKGFITDIVVNKKYRKLGFGNMLLDSAMHKYHGVDLTVRKNNSIAIDMYKKHGFVVDDSLDAGKDMYYMSLKSNSKNESYIEEKTNTDYDIESIVKEIHNKTISDKKEPTGNQNCLLCTWCTEAQIRGYKELPRPVYSPRDTIFNHNGYDIVKNPSKIKIKNVSNVKDIVIKSGNNSRYYIHVNWKGSKGGHEFMLLNKNNEVYVVDSQAGLVASIESFKGSYYFNDINYNNSYLVRLDNKKFNKSILKYNDPSYTLEWDEDKDIKYLRSHGMSESYIEEVTRGDIHSKYLEKNDTCVNLENWQADGYNILYITGLSGSGKTTLAEDLAKEFKCYRIEQDYIGVYFFRKKIEAGTRDKVLNKLAKEAPPDAIRWLKDNKDKYCVDSWKEATPIIKEFTEWFEATHEGDGNLYIINSAWIFEYDPTHFYDRPIIIKESNTFKSLIRRTGRESGHEDSLEKNIKSFIKNISFISKKSYRDAGKRARAFAKNIASNGIEESSSYNYFITNDNGNEHFNVAKYFQMIMFQELDAYMVGNHIHPRDIESDNGCYTIATYTVDNEFNKDHVFNFLNHVSNMINNSVTSKYEIRDMSNGILGVGIKPGHENEVIEDIDNKVCSNFGWSNNDLTIENIEESTVLETSTGARVPKNVRIYRGSTEFGLTKIEPKRNKFNRIEVEASLTFKDAFIDCLDTPSTNIDTKTYKDKVQIYIDKKDFDLATPCVIYLLENDGNWFYKSGKNFNVYRRNSAARIIDSYEFDSAVDAMNIIGGIELYDYKTRLPLNKLLEDADDPLIADTKDNYAIIQTDNYSDLYSVPFQMKLKYGMTDEVFEKAREAQERNPELVIFTCKTMTRDEFDALFNKFKGLSEKQRKICNRLSLSIYGYNMYDMYNRISVVIDKISNTKEHEIETKVEPDLVPSSNVNETLQNYMDYIKQEATSPSRDKARVAEMLMDLHTCDDYTFTESVLVKRFVLDAISLLEDKRIDSTIDLCPYFTPEKMQSMGVYNSNENDNYYKTKSDMSSLDWYKSYCECKEIVDKESWYLTLTERYNDLLKNPTDYNRQRVLELGWNPELYPSIKTIKEASEYTKQSLIESTTLNNIDLSKVDWSKYSINEAANNLLPVFIVTSYTETTFGKFIRKWTNGRYSHAAITFDTTLKELYSFNLSSNTNSLGGGLSFESLDSYIQDCKDALIKVQAIFIKPEEMRIIKSKLDEYIANYKKSHYGIDSLLNVAFNRARKTNDLSMICSEFVARLLSYANIDLANGKSTNIVTPVDLSNTLHKNVYLVYEGLAELYDAKAAEKLVNKLQRTAHYINESSMYGDKISKKLMSYINRDISPLLEARLDIDNNGDLTITDFKKIDFDSEYHHSMKLLKVYNTNGNYEGMKYELAKLWYLNSLLEDKLYNNKNIFKKDLSNYNKMRSKILNLFNTNLKLVTKQEPDFDFQSYYQTTKFYDNRITVTKSTMNGIVDITKRFLK